MPSRDDGFAIMDVSTSICDDPKFRRLARDHPELVAPAFTAYLAVMAESWRTGRRVNVDDAWPAILPFDTDARAALIQVGLLDRRGVLSSKAWRGWFEPARDRRDKTREDWRKWQQAHRNRQSGVSPDSDPDKSIPSVRPPVRPSDRLSDNARARANGTAGASGLSDPLALRDAEDRDEQRRLRAVR